MYDDDDIDRGAFLLVLGTLAAVISIVSWWFLTNNAANTAPVARTPAAAATAPAAAAPAAATVADLVTSNPDFSTLAAQLSKAGLVETLRGPGPFTVFAPTNAAFGSMDAALKRSTDVNTDRLKKVLTYHVVGGRLSPGELAAKTSLDTVAGEKLTVQAGNPVKVADGKLAVQNSVEVGNGIVYIVDAVAVPPTVTQTLKDETALNDALRLEPIRFASGSAEILPESRPTLDKAVAALRTITGNVEIGGHTDNTGTAAGNQTLSQDRANAVRQYLVDAGIPAARLTAVGYGQNQPIADNATPGGQAQNRRIEFRIL